ncbi:copper chaperone PCu(A)C [Pararhizobium sp.]|uniref:copper chaperone PCu(A)C n=1 Tax=Pararhizobium sp. TaxID=1977563 RepID=UPI002717F210|nr:copper chaperone PCu(A)C [Pararhizobium sp.]MDO9417216.1 copper chaperone PCu(A)C [Pararhizobium sp.]
MIRTLSLACAVILSLAATMASAHEFKLGDLEIIHPNSRAMLPGAKVGGGLLKIINYGTGDDRLVAITSPVSDDVQLHEMSMENDVMKMRKLDGGIAIPAGQTVELTSSGLHVMFMAVKEPFKDGDHIPATLTFEKAGTIDVEFNVGPADAKAKVEADPHAGHKM